jgi:ribonuclease P protein component
MKILRETFNRDERLRSVKVIETLFEEGDIFYSPLFKVVWQRSSEALPFPARIAFSVPKKRFRLAVVRNLIRRRMREAYRKNKFMLYEQLVSLDTRINLVVIFRGDNIADYFTIENSMKEILNKLINQIKEKGKKLNLS